jgi:hypothetical protein
MSARFAQGVACRCPSRKKSISGVVMGRKARFSGAGRRREAAPSAARVAAAPVTSRACAWSLGRCWLSLGPGSRFVRGSWSRMRHQSAAAGWWSASGTAAAAGDTSRVASKPALERLCSLSACSGRMGLRWRPGLWWPAIAAIANPRCRRRAACRVAAGRFGWRGRAGVARWSQVTRVDLGGGAPYLDVGDQLGRHGSVTFGRPPALHPRSPISTVSASRSATGSTGHA